MTATDSLVLALDTSSPQASFAIQQGDKLLAALLTDNGTQHSFSFFSHLEVVLQLAGVKLQQINGLAAVTGPGSFTGLRVGLAAALGMAQTLNVPSIGLNTLDVTALAANVSGRILILLDAGRGEVFTGLRQVRPDGQLFRPVADQFGRIENLLPGLLASEAPTFVVGSGARMLEPWAATQSISLKTVSHADCSAPGWQIVQPITPMATVLARYALKVLPDVAQYPLQACYIRPSDAEMKAVA